jgi:transposase
MARKTKLTPDTIQRITQAIAMGATYELASKYGGIHESTFYEWMNTKNEFSDAVKKAEGQAAVGWLAKIEKAANEGEWQAAAWKLERRYPQSYGRKAIDIRSPKDLSKLSDEELQKIVEA